MANKYLDGAGLDHMWDKIKSYLTSNYAAKSHTHTIAQITDLSSNYSTKSELSNGLAGKANVSHTHTIAQITSLQTELNKRLKTSSSVVAFYQEVTSSYNYTLPALAVGEMRLLSVYISHESGSQTRTVTVPSGGAYLFLNIPTGLSADLSKPTTIVFTKSGGSKFSGQSVRIMGFYIRLS